MSLLFDKTLIVKYYYVYVNIQNIQRLVVFNDLGFCFVPSFLTDRCDKYSVCQSDLFNTADLTDLQSHLVVNRKNCTVVENL